MNRKSLVLILLGAVCCIGLLFAHDLKKKSDKIAATKATQLYSNPKYAHLQLPTLRVDEPTVQKKSTAPNSINAAADVIFNDDIEGGKGPWQAGAIWGIRATAGGYLDEDRSDWEPSTTNSHSATHSWHETGATPSSTDLLMSPAFTIPTTVTGGAPLARMSLDFWIDWDAANAANRVYIHLGKDEALWAVETTDPGAGTKSWAVHNPGVPPYDVFSRQYLTTPSIDLTGVAAPISLSFLYKSISEPEFDFNKVDVFTADDNYVSYRSVASFDGPDGSAGGGTAAWKSHTVSLDAYAGKVIKLRFSENGDYGFVQAGDIFALDDITVTGPGGVVFKDDGGETSASTLAAEGFAAGAPIATYQGVANPNPAWINVAVPGNVLVTGASGTLVPGDNARLAVIFAYDPAGTGAAHTTGRGLFVDDFNLVGETIQDDVAADNIDIPFPAKVGQAVTFTLNVTNTGSNPQSNVQWQGAIFNNATGAQVASVVGRGTGTIDPGASVAIPSTNTWTPAAPGVYRIRAFTRLANDEDRTNDTTAVATDDPDGFGDARYSPFVVHDGNVLFSAALWNAPAAATPAQLVARGFQVNTTRSEPGVVTWQTTASALVPNVNLGVDYKGAYVQFDSLGRWQDEDLIIPNLDFSAVTSDAWLTYKALGVAGFGFTRFSVSVSNNGGASWNDVPGTERLRGIDPETGQNYGGPAFFTANIRPAVLNITRWAAGYSNVWVRFRYQALNDGDWTIWNVGVSGKGVQAATLTGVADIPNDQGKQVRVSWTRSPNDGGVAGVPITHYGVWRKIGGAAGLQPEGVVVVENRQAMINVDVQALKAGTRFYDASAATAWDFVASVPAHSDPDYNYVAPTLADGVSTCFIVSAHTANPAVFANSNESCGTSTDDLPPNAPVLSGQPQSGFVALNWTEPDNEEPASYSVYRRLASTPNFGDPIATVTALEYRDEQIDKNTNYVYAVKAKDYADNASVFSNEIPVTTTSVAGRPSDAIPTDYALGNNYPNPFNPTTMITYQLPKAGEVKLTIINSLGQKGRTLVTGQVAAGYHQTLWDARDDNGALVGSGTYLYRIEAGNFVQTKKLVLMK
ncbi:T9SS type A sorting domain-containing protein [candidate division KSB1 bacterium]|nr:T9SS type A sorting domain-containing protein [candidate division KSB1 bacterium]